MTTATLSLYKALLKAGIDEETARQVSEDVVTKDEAKTLATKADIANLKADLQRFLFTALVAQAVFVIGITITLIQALA